MEAGQHSGLTEALDSGWAGFRSPLCYLLAVWTIMVNSAFQGLGFFICKMREINTPWMVFTCVWKCCDSSLWWWSGLGDLLITKRMQRKWCYMILKWGHKRLHSFCLVLLGCSLRTQSLFVKKPIQMFQPTAPADLPSTARREWEPSGWPPLPPEMPSESHPPEPDNPTTIRMGHEMIAAASHH